MRDSVSHRTRMAPKEEPLQSALTEMCMHQCVRAHADRNEGKKVRLVGEDPNCEHTKKTLQCRAKRVSFYVNYTSIKLLLKMLSNAIFCLSGCKPATRQSLSVPKGP